jgi:hypothetical protein
VNVDEHRRRSLITVSSVVRVRRDGIDRAVLRYFGPPGSEIDRVRVVPVRNCVLGRRLHHRDGRMLAAELLLGQQLQAGQTWVWEYEVHEPTSGTATEFAHALRRPEGPCVLEVRFHPDALPAQVHEYFRADLCVERHPCRKLALNAHHALHVTASGMSSGVVGIDWERAD